MADESEADEGPKKNEVTSLRKEVRELNERIRELEEIIVQLREPFQQLHSITRGYTRLIDLYMKFGSVSPDIIVPTLKDPISKEILNVLFERNGQNISQITDAVRTRRGSASRRIVREKLAAMEEDGLVKRKSTKKAVEYFVSDELVRKWSEVLGLTIYRDRP